MGRLESSSWLIVESRLIFGVMTLLAQNPADKHAFMAVAIAAGDIFATIFQQGYRTVSPVSLAVDNFSLLAPNQALPASQGMHIGNQRLGETQPMMIMAQGLAAN